MSKQLNTIVSILAAVLLVPIASYAAGLGTLTVHSALGQPLDAEVEVLSLRSGEETFQARLASRDAYREAGMEYSPALSGVRFTVEARDGKTIIRMRTSQPVNDPYLNLMVELQFPTGRLARQYTVLVDPAEYKVASTSPAAAEAARAATVAPQTPVAVAPPAPTPAASVPAPAASAPTPAVSAPTPATSAPVAAARAPEAPTAVALPAPAAPASAQTPVPVRAEAAAAASQASADVYRIKRGDTLGAIARKWKHEGATMQQMMIGLYQLNPAAFIRENINLIRAGSTLLIPGREEVLAIREEDAVRQIRTQMAAFGKYKRTHAAGTGGPGQSLQAQRDMVGRRAASKKATRSM